MSYYKASDIVKRALELADIADSKVISYKETCRYLDQAWRQVNQKAINKGIKYFYNEIDVTCGYNDLPWDFFQIDSVSSKSGFNLPRHTRGMSDYEPSYDIVGNKLKIYGKVMPILKMKYWKKPVTLMFPNDVIKADIDARTLGMWDCYNNYIVYLKENQLHILNTETLEDRLVDISSFTSIASIRCGKGYFGLSYNTSSVAFINYKGEILEQDIPFHLGMMIDDTIVAYEGTEIDGTMTIDIHSLFDMNNKTYVYENVATFNNTIDRALFDEHDALLVDSDGAIYSIYDSEHPIFDHGCIKVMATTFDGIPAYVTERGYFWRENRNDEWFIEPLEYKNTAATLLIKRDEDTGYGVYTFDGTDLYVESNVPDTLLDFPSSMLFDYLSYLLAYYYTLKLGMDTTNISEAVRQAEDLFYDSLDQNADYKVVADVTGGDYLWV